jgi:hypothetical protein
MPSDYTKHMSNLNEFMQDILHLQVRDFGGAGAGIAGISSSGGVVLHDLKQTVAEFAREQTSPQNDNAALHHLRDKIIAQLQTLEVTNVISRQEAARLTKQLQQLTTE